MTMYAELLDVAIGTMETAHENPTIESALAKLHRCRRLLGANDATTGEPSGVLAAVADQLAFDVALIGLAQLVGIHCDVIRFGQPQQERARLERALADHGIDVEGLS